MSLLDIEVLPDEKMLNHIFQQWLHQYGTQYKACGFLEREGYDNTFKDIPDNYLNWHLGRCEYMNNSGGYCCCFLSPDTEYNYYIRFEEYYIRFEEYNSITKIEQLLNWSPFVTIEQLLNWYNQKY